MALASNNFQRHTQLADFVNANAIAPANILKIDTDSMNGGWVLWYYALGGATQTLHANHFQTARDLTNFVNTKPLVAANILKIDADPASGGWTLFWYS